jgi:CBS domain-containing protein
MDRLLEIAKRPAVTTTRSATVVELCEQMVAEHVGAVAVVEGDRLVGIVSERDVVWRVVTQRRDIEKTTVGDIMTTAVKTAQAHMAISEVIQIMHDGRFRHLPLVDNDGHVVGMLSVRHLLRRRLEELDLKNADLVNFISADGPGG